MGNIHSKQSSITCDACHQHKPCVEIVLRTPYAGFINNVSLDLIKAEFSALCTTVKFYNWKSTPACTLAINYLCNNCKPNFNILEQVVPPNYVLEVNKLY